MKIRETSCSKDNYVVVTSWLLKEILTVGYQKRELGFEKLLVNNDLYTARKTNPAVIFMKQVGCTT